MLNLHYHKWERLGTWSKKYLIVDVYIIDKVLDKIKEIKGIELDNTKILIDTDAELIDDINFEDVVILMTCVKKDDGEFYLQIFSEEALYVK